MSSTYLKQLLLGLCCGGVVISACATYDFTGDHQELSDEGESTFNKPELVTGGNASNFSSDISPNGAYLVYTSSISGNKDLWLKKISRGVSTRLTYHTADDLNPAISPDGQYVAFVSRRQDASGDIHLLELGSSLGLNSESFLESFDASSSEDTQPSWFADSTKVVFTSRRPHEVKPQIMIGTVETLQAKPLEGARGTHPTVSTDGKYICYSDDGALILYDLFTSSKVRLTDGKVSRDGQPRFSQDSKYIYFIRYLQDTTNDGKINADDRPAIWRISLDGLDLTRPPPFLMASPLSSSRYSVYYPTHRPPFLYFTMQSQDSLDVFRLPDYGHTPIDYKASVPLDHPVLSNDIDDTAYEYYRRAHILFKQNHTDELRKLLRQMLAWQVQTNQAPAAHNTFQIIRNVFPTESDLQNLAELQLVKLKIQAISYPDRKFEPTDELAESLLQSHHDINRIGAKIPADSIYRSDADVISQLIKARIDASHRRFFVALADLEKMLKLAQISPYIAAEAQLMVAELITSVSDRSTAIIKLIDVIKSNQSDAIVVRRASNLIVELINEKFDNNLEMLSQVREENLDLPWLSPTAHRAIASYYQQMGESNVAINEFREMVARYTNTPEIALRAAETLVALADLELGSNFENELATLYNALKSGTSMDLTKRALEILVRYRVKKAEFLLKGHDLVGAKAQYESIVAIDQHNINGHRGLIQIMMRENRLEDAIQIYDELSNKNPQIETYAYLYAFSMSFLIDQEDELSGRLSRIDDTIEYLEESVIRGGKVVRVRQTLGWLYYQKHLWERKRAKQGGILYNIGNRLSIVGSYLGMEGTDWLDLAINSYLTALFLADESSYERAELNQNLAEAYYELGNYKKSLGYYVKRIRDLRNFPAKSQSEEAAVIHRAGLAAFQLGENELASSLFEKALSRWQSVANDNEIARSIDYLAMIRTELKDFEGAKRYYKLLIASHERQNNQLNLAIAKINLAQTLLSLNEIKDALLLLDEAETYLKQEDVEWEIAKKDAIEIGLAGGQASETYGFDKTSRMIQISSIRFDIYQKLDSPIDQIKTLIHKIELQDAKRDDQIDDGRDDLYYTEELFASNMALGQLLQKYSSVGQASLAYSRAWEWARIRRGEEQKRATPLESLAVTGLLQSILDQQLLGDESIEDLQGVLDRVKIHLDSVSSADPTADEIQTLSQIATLSEQIKSNESNEFSVSNFKGIVNTLPKSKQITPEMNQALLAVPLPSFDGDGSEVFPDKALVNALRNESIKSPKLLWKYFIAKGMWHQAYELAKAPFLDKQVDPVVESGYDLRLLKLLFDLKLRYESKTANQEQLPAIVAEYYALHALYFSKMIVPSSSYEALPNYFNNSSIEKIRESLSSDETIVMIHRNPYTSTEAFVISSGKVVHNSSAEILSDKVKEELAALPKSSHVYIVVNPDTFALPWSEILNEKTFSFVLAPSERIGSHKAKLLPMSSWQDISSVDLDLSPEESPTDYWRSHDFDKFYASANYLLVRNRLEFDFSHPRLGLVGGGQPNSSKVSPMIDALPQKSESLHTVIYGDIHLEDSGVSYFDKSMSFAGLHVLGLSKGISTTLVSQKEVKWNEVIGDLKGRSLEKYANSNGISVFGLAREAITDDSDELLTLYEDSQDDEEFFRALYYAKVLKDKVKIVEALKALRQEALGYKRFEQAFYFHRKILAYTSASKGIERAADLHMAGQYAMKIDAFDKAEPYLKDAIKIYEDEEEIIEAAKVYRDLSINVEKQKRYLEAIELRKKVREYYLKEDELEQAARQLLDIGNIYNVRQSEYLKAIEYYNKAEAEFRDLKKDDLAESVLIDKANTYMAIGQLNAAIRILHQLHQSIFIGSETTDQGLLRKWIRTSQILANAYYRSAQYQLAHDLVAKMLSNIVKIEEGTQKVSYVLDATNIQAMIEAKIGSYSKAFDILEEGLILARQHNLKPKMTQRYNNLGFLYREVGQYQKSIEVLEKALEIDKELGSEEGIAFDLRNLGLGWTLLGDKNQARDLLTKSLKMSTDLNLPYNRTYSLLGLADLDLRGKDFSSARVHFQNAYAAASLGFLTEFQWRALAGIAIASEQLGDSAMALESYAKSVAIIDNQPPGQKSETSITKLTSDLGTQDVYQRYASLLIKTQKSELSWAIAEQARARSYIDSVASQSPKFAVPEMAAIVARQNLLKAEISSLSQELHIAPQSSQQELLSKIAVLNAAFAEESTKARQKYPRLVSMFDSKGMSLTQIQSQVAPNMALVDFMITSNSILCWIITNHNFYAVETLVDIGAFNAKMAAMQNILNAYSTTSFLASELESVLLTPIKPYLSNVDSLKIIPRDQLNQFSFGLLPFKDKLLIDHFLISYLNSASMMPLANSTHEKIPPNPRVLAIGAPVADMNVIPFAKKEIDSIKRSYPSATLLVGKDATASALKEAASSVDIIHIAGHGNFESLSPLNSYIQLEQSRISVGDVFSLTISPELVTLSACESGMSSMQNGMASLGFSHALFFAGARNVVTSLWRINDVATAVIMKRFYRLLAEGQTKTVALRNAQLHLRQYYKHPAYWAAFRLEEN